FLERHGRFQLAAELAEARGLPPGLVVRQWFLAGQRERAVAIARQTGAFADAVARLEGARDPRAAALRLCWADTLATTGAYAAAVDVAASLREAEPLVLEWLDRAVAVGGRAGWRMLAKKLRRVPESFGAIRDRIRAELAATEGDGWQDLEAFAVELL